MDYVTYEHGPESQKHSDSETLVLLQAWGFLIDATQAKHDTYTDN